MTDKTFGYSKIVLLYNPFKGGITSAIVIGSEDYKEDILVRWFLIVLMILFNWIFMLHKS